MLRYYLLKLDAGYARPPMIENWYEKINKKHIEPENSYQLPYRIILPLQPNMETIFTDIISFPFFLVSERFKSIMNFYEPSIIYKEVILMDHQNSLAALYFLPIMEKVDCLSERSELSLDKSVIKKAVIAENKTFGKKILLLDGVSSTNILVRLDFAESILRRNLQGISLKPVELV